MIGITISHYKIVEKIGQGGMGVVYKAQDTFLHRPVAIKTLPSDLVSNSEFVRRIIQEARTASSLNHPNICTIYDVIEEDNQYFIVMEYLEGKTLRDIIKKRGSLPISETLDIILKVCDALKAAHSKNIIHRDVKPENIMITNNGFVKIMDFGLAKLRNIQEIKGKDEFVESDEKIDPNNLKTSRSVLLGTVTYMAPEQLENKTIDERTDIFSVGIVLYEMLTGRLPFIGNYVYEVSKAILEKEPKQLSEYNKNIDNGLENTVTKCLSKSPSDRYKNVGELTKTLEYVKTKLNREKSVFKKVLLVFAVFTLVILIIFLNQFMFHKIKIPQTRIVFPVTETSEIMEVGASISPDGNFVAYDSDENGNSDLWIQDLKTGERENLTGDYKGKDNSGRWSPDGRNLIFVSDRDSGGVFIISRDGGIPQKIVAEKYSKLRWLCWSPDASKVAYTNDEKLYFIDLNTRVSKHIPLTVNCMFLDWSPKSDRILFVSGGSENPEQPNRYSQLWSVKVDGSDQKLLHEELNNYQFPVWSHDGKYIFFKSVHGGTRDIWAIPIDENGNLKANPVQVTAGADVYDFSLAADGKKIAYNKGGYEFNIWSHQLKRKPVQSKDFLMPVTKFKKQITYMALSPDFKSFAYIINKGGGVSWEIWTMNKYGQDQQFILKEDVGLGPIEWASANTLVFQSFRKSKKDKDGNGDIYSVNIVTSAIDTIISNPSHDLSPKCSPNGEKIVFCSDRTGNFDLWIINIITGRLQQLTETNWDEGNACWAPDGHTIAYVADKTGYWEVYLISLDGGKPKRLTNIQANEEGLKKKMMMPIWSAQGDHIYIAYRPNGENSNRKIVAVSVKDGSTTDIYDIPLGSTQYLPATSLAIDKENLFFISQFYLADIRLLELEYK